MKPHFDNSKLKAIGWKQLVSTEDGIARTFAQFREEIEADERAWNSLGGDSRRK